MSTEEANTFVKDLVAMIHDPAYEKTSQEHNIALVADLYDKHIRLLRESEGMLFKSMEYLLLNLTRNHAPEVNDARDAFKFALSLRGK